jgi:hypothetical protein
MRRTEEGDYDTWGVTVPGGKIREFSTLRKAAMFAERMEGQDVVMADGGITTWTGIKVVHRYIPNWSEVIDVAKTLAELPHGQ